MSGAKSGEGGKRGGRGGVRERGGGVGGGWGGVGVGGLIWVSTLRMRVAARTVPSSSADVNVDVPWRD